MTLDLVHGLIPVLVPLLIAFGKWGLPRVPKLLLPLLAPVLGAAIDVLAMLVGLQETTHPLLGALMGAVGVALREILDQLKKAIGPAPSSGASAKWLLVFGLVGLVGTPTVALADEAAILARIDRLEHTLGARIAALEARVDARAQAAVAPAPRGPADLNAQVADHFAAVAQVKLMQSLVRTLDPPKGFFDQLSSGDSTIPALAVLAVTLKALGGAFSLGF